MWTAQTPIKIPEPNRIGRDETELQRVTKSGGEVRLGDIATVERGYMDPPSNLMRVDGKRHRYRCRYRFERRCGCRG